MEINSDAPNFAVNENINLSEVISQYNRVILLFFHECVNLGCITEIKSFRNYYLKFKQIGCEIIGISTDSKRNLKSFVTDLSLEFPMISDLNGMLSQKYGALGKNFGYLNPKSMRRTFVVDNNMKIMRYYDNIIPTSHADEVYNWISSIVPADDRKLKTITEIESQQEDKPIVSD